MSLKPKIRTKFDLPLFVGVLAFCIAQVVFVVYQTLQVWSPSVGWWIQSLAGMTVFLLGPYLTVLILRRFIAASWYLAVHGFVLLVLSLGSIYGLHERYFGNYGDGGGGYLLAEVLLGEWLLVLVYGVVTLIIYRRYRKKG